MQHGTFSALYTYCYVFSTLSQFEPRSWRGVLDTTLCDIVCQWLVTGQWFSPGTPVSSTNKTDCHDIAEILLKVALNTINQPTLSLTQTLWHSRLYGFHEHNIYLFIPDLKQVTGYVACPRNFGSPKTSSSCTENLSSANSGHVMSKVTEQFSRHTGFNPLSSAKL